MKAKRVVKKSTPSTREEAEALKYYRTQNLLRPPELVEMSDLDMKMENILTRSDLSPAQKLRHYYETLSRFRRLFGDTSFGLQSATFTPPADDGVRGERSLIDLSNDVQMSEENQQNASDSFQNHTPMAASTPHASQLPDNRPALSSSENHEDEEDEENKEDEEDEEEGEAVADEMEDSNVFPNVTAIPGAVPKDDDDEDDDDDDFGNSFHTSMTEKNTFNSNALYFNNKMNKILDKEKTDGVEILKRKNDGASFISLLSPIFGDSNKKIIPLNLFMTIMNFLFDETKKPIPTFQGKRKPTAVKDVLSFLWRNNVINSETDMSAFPNLFDMLNKHRRSLKQISDTDERKVQSSRRKPQISESKGGGRFFVNFEKWNHHLDN
jgi:hypothetical protein